MATFKKVGAGWITKNKDGIRGVMNEDVPQGAKILVQKNKYKTTDAADEKKPDYVFTQIIEDEEVAQQEFTNEPF